MIIVTSSQGTEEWLAASAGPLFAQSALDQPTSNAYDLLMRGESYRNNQKPSIRAGQ